MSYSDKLVYAFNAFYLNFLTDIKGYSDAFKKEVKTNYKVFNKSSPEYIQAFADSSETLMMRDWTLDTILDAISSDEDKNTINGYYFIFKALNSIHEHDDAVLETVLDIIGTSKNKSSTQETMYAKLDSVLDDDLKSVLKQLVDINISATPKTDDANPFSMFDNTTIGDLAKEISSEIDISQLNIQNPEQLLDFSNLGSSNNILGNIVSKVSNKIQNKISSGELNQQDLMSEAMSFLGAMGGAGGAGGGAGGAGGMSPMDLFNNPMMKDLFSGMAGSMAGSGKNSGGGGRMQMNTSKVKQLETKARLQQKLAKRKAESANK
jgi:hypothetical protein